MNKGFAYAELTPALRNFSKHVTFWGSSQDAVPREHDHNVFWEH